MMLKWVPECLSPAFLNSATQIQYAKLKTRSGSIIQNRGTVLDKAALSFAASPANEKTFLPSLMHLQKVGE